MNSELIQQLTMAPLAAGVVGIIVACFFYYRVKALPEGTDTMNLASSSLRSEIKGPAYLPAPVS